MSNRQFRRRNKAGTPKLRGHRNTQRGRAGVAKPGKGLLTKCGEPHPHDDCPAECTKFKGHQGRHVGYVMQGVEDKKTGKLTVRGRVEVQWTDEDAKEWKAVQEAVKRGEVDAGAVATPVRSTDGREWTEDKILPAGG